MMDAFSPSHILIFGATGQIGRYITESLIRAQPAFPRLTVFTSPSTAAGKTVLLDAWRAAGIGVVVGDLTAAGDVAAAYADGVDTVVSCVGRDAIGTQQDLIRLADESGSVRWFFPSEYGTDIEHGPQSGGEKPHQHKLALRRYVRDKVRRLKVTYLVTGPYFDMWVKLPAGNKELGGFNPAGREAYLVGDGEGRIAFTTMWE